MNGNQLADILKYGGGEWRAGEVLPKEWWKTDFPYGEAEKMGYKLSPEEARASRRRQRGQREPKDISEMIASILSSKDFMMLDPNARLKVIQLAEQIKEAKAQAERERLAEGREEVKRKGEERRAEELHRMAVWEEKYGVKEGAPRPKGEELAAALRPEPRGVQVRMVGEELIKEPAGIWEEERLTPEQKITRREAELKIAEYHRERALERKYPKLAIPLEERKFTAEEERLKREFEFDVKELDRKYGLDVEELGEAKAENLRSYNLDKLKEDRTWKETLFDMGFKDKEFNELSKQFWGTLDFNKEKEKTRAKEFDVELEFDKEKEATVMDRFEKELEQEYKRLDLDVKRLGLNEQIEARIAKMALFNFELDVKRLGLDEAILKWERIVKKKEWYFKDEELKLKNTQAQRLFKDLIHRISQDAKEFGLEEAIHRENIRQFDETMKVEWKKLEGTPEAKIEIGGNFGADLSGLGAELQDEVMGYIKSTYNAKTDKLFFPNLTQLEKISNFVFGKEGEKKSREQLKELGINLPADEFMKKVALQPMWSPELKGWCIRSRYNENVWQGMCKTGSDEGVYIPPGEVAEPDLWEKITGWWPFGKEKKEPTEVNFAVVKTHVDMLYDRTKSMAEVERYLKEDVGVTLDEYKEWLRGR